MLRRFRQLMPSFSRQVNLLLTSSTLYGLTLIGINNVLGVLFQLRLGMTAGELGTVAATGAACYAASSLVSAKIAAKLGLQKALIMGVVTITLGMGLVPLAEYVGGFTVWLAMANGIANIGWGIATSLELPAYSAAAKPRQRGRAIGLNIGVRNIGRLIGVLAAGFLPTAALILPGITANSASAYGAGLWVSFGIMSLTLWPLLKLGPLAPPAYSNQQTAHQTPPRKMFILIALLGFMGFMSQNCVLVFGNAYLDSQLALTTPAISRINAIAIALAAIAAFSASSVTERIGSKTSIVLAVALMGLFTLPIALIQTTWAAIISIIAETSTAALFVASAAEHQMRLIQPHERPRMSSTWCAAAGLGSVLVSQGGGVFIDHWGYQPFFLVGALIGIPALLIALLMPQAHVEDDADETDSSSTSAVSSSKVP